MSNRETNLNKTYIRYIPLDNKYFGIVVFDVNEPSENKTRFDRISSFDDYDLIEDCSAIVCVEKNSGSITDSYSICFGDALKIAREYRPGIGRDAVAVWMSLALNIIVNGRQNLFSIIKLPTATRNSDDCIGYIIRTNFGKRHQNPNTTDHNKKRFILIPYLVSMRTKPLSSFNAGHFVTLIVDLDYKKLNENNFTPFVYVYDSAHFLCHYYGLTGSIVLNKDDYFQFGQQVIVDDYTLNDDFNRCVCSCCAIGSLSSKIQCIVDLRCGYYCEASINVLLEDDTVVSNDGLLSDGTILAPGIATRNYLKDLLLNYKVQAELAIINPPFPQPF